MRGEILDALFRFLADGDVLDHGYVVENLVRAAALRGYRKPDPQRRPVLAQVALFHLVRLDNPRTQSVSQVVGGADVARMRNLLDGEAEQLLLAVSKHLAKLRIHIDEAPGVVDVCDTDGCELHRRGKPLFALAQAFHREHALIEVGDFPLATHKTRCRRVSGSAMCGA